MRPCSLQLACAAAAALAIACGGTSPGIVPADLHPLTDGPIRIVTWNVHDLFDEQDSTAIPGNEDLVLTTAAVETKLRAVGRVLTRIDPDVAILQEVENEMLLQRLSDGPLAGRQYGVFLREGLDPRGIDVGVLSRLPFTPGASHLDDRSPDGRHLWARDPLVIVVQHDPVPLALVGVHLVSRLDSKDDARRRLQATRLREIADDLRRDPNFPCVVVAGDLNDLPDAPALEPLLEDGAWVDLGRALPVAAGWTWEGGGLHERMDYALIGRSDLPLVTRFAVVDGPDVAAASDHRPLVVDLWPGRPRP
jgi:endonuclease/exonuclease/phosphatase family metal-dependent hydrolase